MDGKGRSGLAAHGSCAVAPDGAKWAMQDPVLKP